MQWIRDIALFLVFSGILLEMISDTKYYKFAKWVAGMILLLQFLKPLADTENLGNIGENIDKAHSLGINCGVIYDCKVTELEKLKERRPAASETETA